MRLTPPDALQRVVGRRMTAGNWSTGTFFRFGSEFVCNRPKMLCGVPLRVNKFNINYSLITDIYEQRGNSIAPACQSRREIRPLSARAEPARSLSGSAFPGRNGFEAPDRRRSQLLRLFRADFRCLVRTSNRRRRLSVFSLEIRGQRTEWFSRLSPLEVCRKVAEEWYFLSPQAKKAYYHRCHSSGDDTAPQSAASSPSEDAAKSQRQVSVFGSHNDSDSDGDTMDRSADAPFVDGPRANSAKSRHFRYDFLGRRRRIPRKPAPPKPPKRASTSHFQTRPRRGAP
jgi:hypothetical protein